MVDFLESENCILNVIENDEFYKQFLDPQTAKSTLSSSLSIAEQVKKLGEGIDLLSKELQKQVLERHGDLLRQAGHVTKLENVLNTMQGHVHNLFANAERLRGQINGPYDVLETHTKVLSRLHLASHILRQVNRIQQLNRRLSNTNDPIQKAVLLQELEQLVTDPELSGIDAVTAELRNVRAQQQKIVNVTSTLLNQGMSNENIGQTTTALQIFLNLGVIQTTVQKTTDVSLGECRESLKSALDISGGIGGIVSKNKGGPTRPTSTSLQNIRTRVWSDLEKAFSEEIYQQCKQIKFLQSVLNNLDVHKVNINIGNDFWERFCQSVTDEIKNADPVIQQMLEEDYPKLLKCYYDVTQRLNCDRFKFDRTVLEKCENAYLSTSLTRLLEPTQSMFTSENNIPTHEQIDSLIRCITSELSVALVEEQLIEKVSRNVSKCIKMFAVKTEQQLATGSDAAQVIAGSTNSGQRMNVQLANAMYYFQVQVQRILSNMKDSLSTASVTIITDSLQSLNTLTAAILQPLVSSIISAIETIIVTIHDETDWTKVQIPSSRTVSCSPYMRELTQFITRVYQTFLTGFENKEVLGAKCNEIAIRCIELFVRHTCLLRPISQGGRMRLGSDYTHLEQALKTLYPVLSDLGRPFRLFKSMVTLITLSPSEIVASQVTGSCVPPSTVLLLLFSFAGPELASPHQNTGWTISKLSAWLDEHQSESDRLDLIAGALQRYENIIRQKNSTNYDPVYPIMSKYLETVTK